MSLQKSCSSTLIFLVSLFALLGCGLVPEKVAIDDPRIQPLLNAAASFPRTRYGFTPIPKQANVTWESRPRSNYDAMLHVYSNTSRTISFRKGDHGYRWTGEQEIFRGPKEYTSVDGTFKEQICLTYEVEHISGAPLNQLEVIYLGDDHRLTGRSRLTLSDVKPILQEWGY